MDRMVLQPSQKRIFAFPIDGEIDDLVPIAGSNCEGDPLFATPFLFGVSNQLLVFKILCFDP